MINSDKYNSSRRGDKNFYELLINSRKGDKNFYEPLISKFFCPLRKHPKKTISACIILGLFCFYLSPKINQQTEENVQPSTKLEYLVEDTNSSEIIKDINHPK